MLLTMQQIGEETFWSIKSNIINENIVLNGILKASIEIGNKQLRLILDKIENESYDKILLKLGKNKLLTFEKNQIEKIFSKNENKILNEFLSQMKTLNILEHVGKKINEKYTFTNRLYFVYFLIKANISI